MVTDAMPVTAADFDALEDVMRRWVGTVKERSLHSRAFKEAARAWVEEASQAEGIDLGVTGCLRRAASAGIEPADEDEIREGLAGMTQLAALGRGQLDVLAGLEAKSMDQFRRRDVQDSLDRIFAASRRMEEQQPMLDEWERLIQLIGVGD
jgi:hypothetical protein